MVSFSFTFGPVPVLSHATNSVFWHWFGHYPPLIWHMEPAKCPVMRPPHSITPGAPFSLFRQGNSLLWLLVLSLSASHCHTASLGGGKKTHKTLRCRSLVYTHCHVQRLFGLSLLFQASFLSREPFLSDPCFLSDHRARSDESKKKKNHM